MGAPLNVKYTAHSQWRQVSRAQTPSKEQEKAHETYTKLFLIYPRGQGLYLESRRRKVDTRISCLTTVCLRKKKGALRRGRKPKKGRLVSPGFGARLKFPGRVRRCCEEDPRNSYDGRSSNENMRGTVRRQLQ